MTKYNIELDARQVAGLEAATAKNNAGIEVRNAAVRARNLELAEDETAVPGVEEPYFTAAEYLQLVVASEASVWADQADVDLNTARLEKLKAADPAKLAQVDVLLGEA